MTNSHKQYALLSLSILILLGLASCTVNNNSLDDPGYKIQNSETDLSERLADTDQDIEVIGEETSQSAKAKAKNNFSLKQVAEIDAPVVDGVETMATMVTIFGNSSHAAVSYNVQGDEYIGAVDAVQVTSSGGNAIRVRSGIEFTNAKANAAFINANNLLLAHSSEDPDLTDEKGFSAARKFGLSGFTINDNPSQAGIEGFAANSIHESEDVVYVTSGNNAGLTLFNSDLSEQIGFIDIEGARWVDTDENRIVVLSGSPETGKGTLHLFDKTDLSPIAEYSFDGADTPEAKSTVEIEGDLAIVAAGRSGTHLIDLSTGDIVATVPVPDASSLGLDPEAVESNAASADEEFIFIANGEAGVYVAEASADLSSYTSGSDLTIELLGYLKFNDFQSANHVAYRSNTLFVAAGLGGVKAVKLQRK